MTNENRGDGAFTGEEVVETPDFVFFWKPPAVFGQWTPSRFTVDGIAIWVARRYDTVVAGNMAKFGQNPSMREALLRTGTKVLAEASPLDRIWGIGLRADDPRALVRSQWQGENLLGEALMVVRARLGAG